jgi:hypothetical protein
VKSQQSEARLQIDRFVADKLRETGEWTSARGLSSKVFLAQDSLERALGRLLERGHIEQAGERYRWLVSEVNVPVGFSRRPASARSWREEIETTSVLPDGSLVVLYVYDDRISDGGQTALRVGEDAVKRELQRLRQDDVAFDAGELFGAVTDGVAAALGDVCVGIVSACETVPA